MKPFVLVVVALLSTCGNRLYASAAPQPRLSPPLYVPPHLELDAASSLSRRASSDPSCPDGYLCGQQACPAGVICADGDSCFSFEGTLACGPGNIKYHGNCYVSNAVCCDFPSIKCTVGQRCNACSSGETCAANTCVAPSPSSSSTTTKSATRSVTLPGTQSATQSVSQSTTRSSTSSAPPSSTSSDEPGPTPINHVQKSWVAFGDSFAAGPGAGYEAQPPTSGECMRRTGSYPYQLDKQSWFGDAGHHFHFLACSGAVTDDLNGTQFLNWPLEGHGTADVNHTDIATISIGGNDVGFVKHRFHDCDAAMDEARGKIEALGPKLFDTYDHILQINDRFHGPRHFQLLVTGYDRFFNAETEACNHYSFGFWFHVPLAMELRQQLNNLTVQLNDKIADTVDSINDKHAYNRAQFVDTDPQFEGHRFCEDGVVEPDGENKNTWFFLINGEDSPAPSPEMPVNRVPLSDEQCVTVLAQAKDWGNYIQCAIRDSLSSDPSLEPVPGALGPDNDLNVPDLFFSAKESYVKAFHPKSAGHAAVVGATQRTLVKQPVAPLHRALVMFHGTIPEFNLMKGTIPRLGGIPTSYTRGDIALKGYYTWMSEATYHHVKNYPGVKGISWYPADMDIEVPDLPDSLEDNANEAATASDNNIANETHQKRQMTQSLLTAQLPERGTNLWHLKHLSRLPAYSGEDYWEYGLPIFEAWKGRPRIYAHKDVVAGDYLIVVGATDEEGLQGHISNHYPNLLTTFAPGIDVTVVGLPDNYRIGVSGTSYSTAITAGVAAYFLGRADLAPQLQRPHVGAKMKSLLKRVATYHSNGGIFGIEGYDDVLGLYNYIPCSAEQTATSSGGDDLVTQKIRAPGFLLAKGAGAECTSVVTASLKRSYKRRGCWADDPSHPVLVDTAFPGGRPAKTINEYVELCAPSDDPPTSYLVLGMRG
ncbi:hypothetical protein B0H66DRAFT_627134 [Apodospora peruviana]|uniref:Uncharacterized protein n=1 Tax=Apodospora peruviana TaxID=516989 RepID=A0AAE0M0N4_9PEZI|nr:hypothetical protein B0H66DRAFT_627134 [Apodospora peruviana]